MIARLYATHRKAWDRTTSTATRTGSAVGGGEPEIIETASLSLVNASMTTAIAIEVPLAMLGGAEIGDEFNVFFERRKK